MANERFSEYIEEHPKIWLQNLYEESSTQKHPLGTRRRLSDGREFVYVKAGATNIVSGVVCQTATTDPTNTANLAVTANANVGERSIAFTMGDSTRANTANAYAEGWAYINLHAANGATAYKIRYHAAIAANAGGTLYLYDKVRANITTSNKVSLAYNKHAGVLVHASVPTGAIVGVTLQAVTANYYAWLQTKGEAAVLTQGTLVVGDHCIPDSTTDGAVGPNANGSETEQIVGRVVQVNANGQHSLIDLAIA